MINFRDLTYDEIKDELIAMGEQKFRAEQIFRWLHKGVYSFDEMTNIPKKIKYALSKKYYITSPNIVKKLESKIDKTKKYLFMLYDGNMVESVVMYYKHGITICISSQVGCAMGCKFCASTIGGLVRNLTSGEIIDQIIFAQNDIGERISNVVMMGIGEPLANFENVSKFLKNVNDSRGLNIGYRHISLSTCGIVPSIYRLAQLDIPITLSVSLHATTNEKRSAIMPINDKYSIQELLKACHDYQKITGRRISYEYAIIKGVNDDDTSAYELVNLLKGDLAHINIIPVNTVEENNFSRPDAKRIKKFCSILEKNKITATVRRKLGNDINASCGQLRKKQSQGSDSMKFDGNSDKGKIRKDNEDSYLAGQITDKCFLALVADGMGGHKGGKKASEIATERIFEFVKDKCNEFSTYRSDDFEKLLISAADDANKTIYDLSNTDERFSGMGTTVVACLIYDGKYYAVSAGDSRMYIYSGSLIQITKDHSYVRELVDMGLISEQQALAHPKKNVITRALGTEPEINLDFYSGELSVGGIILLCTDGLTNMVSADAIEDTLQHNPNVSECVQNLIKQANENGGNDNISIVMLKHEQKGGVN